jgi:signal peptidase I
MPDEMTRSGEPTGDAAGRVDGVTSVTSPQSGGPDDQVAGRRADEPADDRVDDGVDEGAATDTSDTDSGETSAEPTTPGTTDSVVHQTGRFIKEVVIIVVIALVASALLRAFVVQAFYVPSGSMLPAIQLQDRILVSRIGDIERGEVVVFEDPGGWIPPSEQAAPPGPVRKALEFIGVLPASGHEHLVKRVIGLPGDHVVCCDANGKLTINGAEVDESSFLAQGNKEADNVDFDVVVPKDHIFVLGDNRYVSGDSSRHLEGQDAFIPTDLVTGRAFAVIWPIGHRQILHIPDAYDDVPEGRTPPDKGIVNPVGPAAQAGQN